MKDENCTNSLNDKRRKVSTLIDLTKEKKFKFMS